MRRLFAVVAVVTIVATACSTGADSASDVRPFADIQDSDLVFENDPTFPGRAIFRVTTTEPAICAIVWGTTESLGSFNNSLNMNGTGIVQHDVFLPGAEAGASYFYRLQGSTADGTLFQSELMTFTLPAAKDPAAASEDGALNLALTGIVTEVSSEFSSQWAGANAIDGDLTTEWSSAGDGDDSFITIDLGEPTAISGFEFLTRTMADGSATATSYTVTVDGATVHGPYPAGNPADTKRSAVETEGQTFRFDVSDSTGGNTGAMEIRVLAPPA
jgi:hypothetical protein